MTEPRRVLFAYRADVDGDGGAATVMRETARALAELGVEVETTYEAAPSTDGFDLVHAVNIWHPRTALAQLRHLRATGVPVVWLPFHLGWSEVAWASLAVRVAFDPARSSEERAAVLEAMRTGALEVNGLSRWRPNEVLPGFHADLRAMLECVDHVCAISAREMQSLFQAAGIVSKPWTHTPHGVDPAFFEGSAEPFLERFGLSDFVLCVGAVEPRKNQLLLVEALRGTELELVLVGPSFEPDYLELCLREGRGRVRYLERLPRELVASAYRAARVHALPSFAEGAALASLEAAASGCPVVVGNRSSEFEYFGDLAYACDPADPGSIREAVVLASNRRGREAERWRALQERMRGYTWRRTAEATLEAYRRTLRARRPAGDGPRSLCVLALADELLACPELLAAWGRAFGAGDDATLVIHAPGSVDRVAALVERLGLGGEDGPDLLAVGVEAGSEAELAMLADHLLTRVAREGPLGRLVRVDEASLPELRRRLDGEPRLRLAS
jgi:glycosyltransferase involved in cell wall biosynthesis